jgi:hypothetical protein
LIRGRGIRWMGLSNKNLKGVRLINNPRDIYLDIAYHYVYTTNYRAQ